MIGAIMFNSNKLSIVLFALTLGCVGAASGMSAQELIAECKKEQKEDRDIWESFIVLDQNFKEVSGGGLILHKFRNLFRGLDGQETKFSRKDDLELLKNACEEAKKENKPKKFVIFDQPSFDYRIKVFALCGKNKTHYVVKFSESQHLEFLADGSVLK